MSEKWHAGDFYDLVCACKDGKHGVNYWVCSTEATNDYKEAAEVIAQRDRIVVDHNAAEQVRALREALELIASGQYHEGEPPDGCPDGCSCADHVARAALHPAQEPMVD